MDLNFFQFRSFRDLSSLVDESIFFFLHSLSKCLPLSRPRGQRGESVRVRRGGRTGTFTVLDGYIPSLLYFLLRHKTVNITTNDSNSNCYC